MKSILKNYRRRLLNLSTSNKALLLLRLSKELHLDVTELDFLNSSPAFSIIQQLISGKQKISICPFADSRYAPVTPASRRLRYIQRRSDMIVEERGSQELYVGWPFVHGKFSDGTVVRCPFIFFPVKLQVNAKQEWELLQDSQTQPHFNQSLLLAYAHYTSSEIAETLAEMDWSSMPRDPLAFRTQVYELLKESGLAIHAGHTFFADRLKPFPDLKKKELEETTKPGELYLEQEAVLGIYPQAASFLLQDFDMLLQQDNLNEMSYLFSAADTETIKDTALQAQQTFTAFAIDASQEAIVQQVKQGRSVVVQGPPGTGKSQLICNLVSDFTARGKKVLVVSQKRAALDVVHQRLASKGLHHFAALVHDMRTDRSAVFAQLLYQIEQLDTYKMQNLALNSIQTDRAFLEVCRGVNRCTQQLSQFKAALFDTSVCGWSPKELYLLSDPTAPSVLLTPFYKHFTADVVAGSLPKLRQYLTRAQLFEQQDFPLKDRLSFKDWGWPEKQKLLQLIKEVPDQFKLLQDEFCSNSGVTFSLQALPTYEASLPIFEKIKQLLADDAVLDALQSLPAKQSQLKELAQQVQKLEALYQAQFLPDSLISADLLENVKTAIARYEQQEQRFTKKISWLFSRDKKVLKQALANYNLPLESEPVKELKERIEKRSQVLYLTQSINKKTKLDFTIEVQPHVILSKIAVLKQALAARDFLFELQQRKVLSADFISKPDLQLNIVEVASILESVLSLDRNWRKWMPDGQLEKIISQTGYSEDLILALDEHFDALVAHDALYAALNKDEKAIVKLILAEGLTDEEAGISLFLNSIYLAWLHDLETKSPILKSPSTGELDNLETELQRLLEEKNRLSQEIVLSRLREQTYQGMEFNRLGNAVTYRRLQVQVSKKRALYPIRKLLTLFQDEIFRLVPCWLASPETVSAVMPFKECFDLVIFDEASQCFAEVGIPAIVRGKQVVVAGDAQQLKPTDLYRARWNPEDEDAEELAADSLLQLCSLYLPQAMLTQHYRSLYPELISFSNQHFYRGKLELIPEKENLNATLPAIGYLQVPGVWQHNVNLPEAEKVVQLVLELLASGQEDIGVITFNFKQQLVVLDMLENAMQTIKKTLPPTVLVKNIENIQGDEKAVIILSVGYAPNEQGKMSMQFGSLNQAGGENRLNVAITRAKKKVIVVTSIQPEQLQVDDALHKGPKLLKAYLQYARQVSNGNFAYHPIMLPIPVHATLLKIKLQQEIQGLQTELPFADLTFKKQDLYESLVLTDDDLYYAHVAATQSHADLPARLTARGWPYQKVYSRQYWQNRGKVLEQLKVKLTNPTD